MATVLIVGASRGIGLEFVRQYAMAGWRVIAGCRTPASVQELVELRQSHDVAVEQMDVRSEHSIKDMQKKYGDMPLDLVICSAGVLGGENQAFGTADFAGLADAFDVNVAGPLRVAQAFAPNLCAAPSAKLIAITSKMGSISETTSTEMMFYRTSKAALNEAWKCVAIDLRPKGVIAMVLHPGWVRTALGGPQAPLSPADSVKGLCRVIEGLTPDDAGTFRTWDGEVVPW